MDAKLRGNRSRLSNPEEQRGVRGNQERKGTGLGIDTPGKRRKEVGKLVDSRTGACSSTDAK
jgi:hypothetical protein